MKVIKLIINSILNYFLTTAEQIIHNIFNNNQIDRNNTKIPVHYLSRLFKNPFPQIKFSNTSTKKLKRLSVLYSQRMWHAVVQLVEALHYKPEGHGFDSR
jgi:hypothetical protein